MPGGRRLYSSSNLYVSPLSTSVGGMVRRAMVSPLTSSSSLKRHLGSTSPVTSPHTPEESIREGKITEKEALILGYPYKLVDTVDALKETALCLNKSRLIALDIEAFCTESDRKHLGQISLIQACTDVYPVVFLIDVLVLSIALTKQYLAPVLENAAITKLFFDCRRDIEALSVQMGLTPNTALDLQLQFTALQWRLRSVNRRSGMAYVLKDVAGITRPAGHAAVHTAMTLGHRPVWDVRPLPAHFLDYAADDVRQILLLAPILERRCNGVVSMAAVHRLTARYAAHYGVGRLVEEEADEKSAEVNQTWLERDIGSGGKCAFCHAKGHTEAECFKKTNRTTRCTFCGDLGHTSRNCYQKHPQLLKCDLCGQVGHPASSCYKKNPCIHCGGFHNSANCHRHLQKGSYPGDSASKRAVYGK
ncbi:unnamed protein product [Phytomonas sp. EM1]|nr:unnamed protein product [Phytomonas sp. EM1]|eukprot:CCW62140.1 unnamed protein product [Phytomonas sp. isolate EM1]